MKRFTFLKAFVLSCLMAAISLLPMSLNAQQKSDDFFHSDDTFSGDSWRTAITVVGVGGITNYGIGEEVPVGSGLLILLGVGAGYAVSRRKRNLKSRKGVSLFLAFALLIGMTQCKKNVEQIVPNAGNGVHITLNVGDGSKVNVNPTGGSGFATVTFEQDDKIYVGHDGKYCGFLTYNESTGKFSGDIDPTTTNTDDYLHFYFLGNKAGNLTAGDTECTFDIIDQTSKYPVISYAHSIEMYGATTEYTAKLQNYCAIVKFNVVPNMSSVITITGVKNKVTLNFGKNNGASTDNPFSYGVVDGSNGMIRLHPGETYGEKWAIILPLDNNTDFDAYAFNHYKSNNSTIPAIAENGYNGNGVDITFTEGAKPGTQGFTINSYGDRVMFATGNLQFNGGNTWHIASNQWDYYGQNGQTLALDDNTNQDLFRVNTWNTSIDNSGGYTWRVLTRLEWLYILGTNVSASSTPAANGSQCRRSSTVGGTNYGRYTKAVINVINNDVNTGTKGLIIFPDYYDGVTPSGVTFSKINDRTSQYTTTCDSDGWSSLAAKGCVFLPAAGFFNNGTIIQVGGEAKYWASDSNYHMYMYSTLIDFYNNNYGTNYGYSVRLVRDI